ncbi:sugar ABC transporter ATP-binding protein [Spiribacter curvatus]|nr:sugar ABC transporter ATP-binding protein [Spiribacter curvatus]
MAGTETGDVILAARNIAKSFGGVHALKGVNFDVRAGQVTTLFGENGAGKSTLMKILSGVLQPSSGQILLDGNPVEFNSTSEAAAYGVSIIHQELSLATNLNVRDNIFLGREIHSAKGVDYAEETRQTQAIMDDLEEAIDPLVPVDSLRLGQQQIVEIARALSVNSRILIMDEPTSALSAAEVTVLFGVINELKTRGVSIVYISHHLEEALQVTDEAVVLRDGSMVASAPRDEINLAWVVQKMVGRHFDLGTPPEFDQDCAPALEIRDLSIRMVAAGGKAVTDLNLSVRPGEITCIYGLMGAGRTELLECLAGRIPAESGEILLRGHDISDLGIPERIRNGLVLVPEDRQRDGLVQAMSVGRNLSLASILDFCRGLLVSDRREREIVNRAIREVTVKTDGPDAPVSSLSGGNQQKVVIGKMLATSPSVMVLDEPSRGVDVGAKGEVFRLLADHAEKGLAVIYSTSEVEECIAIAHRIIVMHRGRIVAEFSNDATKEEIMAASGEAVIA